MKSSKPSSEITSKTVKRKKCSSCGKVKDASDFFNDKSKKTGLSSRCRVCSAKARLASERSNIETVMLRSAKRRAAKKGIDFTIVAQDIYVPPVCPCLGIPIEISEGYANDNSPSLDRIDNSKGYTPDNIWVISNKANMIKNISTPDELELIAEAVRDRLLHIDDKQMRLRL